MAVKLAATTHLILSFPRFLELPKQVLLVEKLSTYGNLISIVSPDEI